AGPGTDCRRPVCQSGRLRSGGRVVQRARRRNRGITASSTETPLPLPNGNALDLGLVGFTAPLVAFADLVGRVGEADTAGSSSEWSGATRPGPPWTGWPPGSGRVRASAFPVAPRTSASLVADPPPPGASARSSR